MSTQPSTSQTLPAAGVEQPASPDSARPAPTRYAVYFAPDPAHPLWGAGCAWLGGDARWPGDGLPDGPSPAQATVDRPAAQFVASLFQARPWVAQPRRYGWHATLMAPTALAPGVSPSQWLAAVAEVAAGHAVLAMPGLQVDWLDGFLALRPIQPLPAAHPLRRLADDVVRRLNPLRQPLDAAETARRSGGLTDARQRLNVAGFGYPHVLHDWRFHMTLSERLSAADARTQGDRLMQAARRHFEQALSVPLVCDALSVFVETHPGAAFQWRYRLPLKPA